MFRMIFMLQISLLLLMLVGIILKKLHWFSPEVSKCVSDILIYICLPAGIISSFQGQNLLAMARELGMILLLSVLAPAIGWAIGCIFFRRKRISEAKLPVLRLCVLCTTSNFIGVPVCGELYGNVGTLYGSVAAVPNRIAMWSVGIKMFLKEEKKSVLKTTLTHPCVLAVIIGFAIMVLNITFPPFVEKAMKCAANSTTFLCMITIGAILADVDAKTVFTKEVLLVSVLRLLIIPLFVLLVVKRAPLSPEAVGVLVLFAGMPVASFAPIVAQQHGADAFLGAKLVFSTVLLSVFTLPLISLLF